MKGVFLPGLAAGVLVLCVGSASASRLNTSKNPQDQAGKISSAKGLMDWASKSRIPARDFQRIWIQALLPTKPDYFDDFEETYTHPIGVDTAELSPRISNGQQMNGNSRPRNVLDDKTISSGSKAFTALKIAGTSSSNAPSIDAAALMPGDILVHPDQETRIGGMVLILGKTKSGVVDPYRYEAIYFVDGKSPYERDIVLAKGEPGDKSRELRTGFSVLRIKDEGRAAALTSWRRPAP